jgi:hypothetical protein
MKLDKDRLKGASVVLEDIALDGTGRKSIWSRENAFGHCFLLSFGRGLGGLCWLSAGGADLRLGCTQRPAAARAWWAIIRDPMVEDSARIRFVKSGDSFILRQHRAVHFLQYGSTRSRGLEGSDPLEFVIFQHRDFHLASPTPENLHCRNSVRCLHDNFADRIPKPMQNRRFLKPVSEAVL